MICLQYTPNDPVVHALKLRKEPMAVLLMELGFSCHKVYQEERFLPCLKCKDCAYGCEDSCPNGKDEDVDLNASFLCREYEFKNARKLINQIIAHDPKVVQTNL